MPAVSISPLFNGWQGFTAGGLPLSGGFINTYLAGTTTPALTYTDSAGTIANATAIQLDSAGRPPAEIWLVNGTAYKFIVTDSLALDPRSFDNIIGVGTTTGAGTFTDLTTTGNNILGNAQTDTTNIGNGDIVKDNAGYTGFGVAPTAGRGKIQLAGSANGGILLGNQSNTYNLALDHYEENPWTPRFAFGGVTTGWTLTGTGTFTRIGNIVFFTGSCSYTVKGAGAGVVTITGLPYAVNASFGSYVTTAVFQTVGLITGEFISIPTAGATVMQVGYIASPGAFTQLNSTDFPVAPAFTTVGVTGFYVV